MMVMTSAIMEILDDDGEDGEDVRDHGNCYVDDGDDVRVHGNRYKCRW